MPPRFIARQLSHPAGLLGRIVVPLMNRRNAKVNDFAFQQLELTPNDQILEIGFGGAMMLRRVLKVAAFVAGLDPSEDVVRDAKARFAAEIADGKIELRQGTAESIPFPSGAFSRVCTIHTIYFWPALDIGFQEMRRVLSPNGKAVVGFLPKEHMDRGHFPADIFKPRTPEEVIAALTRAGFQSATVERPTTETPWNVIVADAG